MSEPQMGQWYTSAEDGRRMQLIEEGVCGDPESDNPILNVPYYALLDERGQKWYVRKVKFWFDFVEEVKGVQ